MSEWLVGDVKVEFKKTEEVPLTFCGFSATRIDCPAIERLGQASAVAMKSAGEADMERLRWCYF